MKLLYGLARMTALHRPDGGSAGSRFGCDSMPMTTSWWHKGARSVRDARRAGAADQHREREARPPRVRAQRERGGRTSDHEHVGVEVDAAVLVEGLETQHVGLVRIVLDLVAKDLGDVALAHHLEPGRLALLDVRHELAPEPRVGLVHVVEVDDLGLEDDERRREADVVDEVERCAAEGGRQAVDVVHVGWDLSFSCRREGEVAEGGRQRVVEGDPGRRRVVVVPDEAEGGEEGGEGKDVSTSSL